MERFRKLETEWNDRQGRMSQRDHLVLDDVWTRTLKAPPGMGSTKKKYVGKL